MKIFAILLISSMLAAQKTEEPPKIDLHLQLKLANVEKQELQLEAIAVQLRAQIQSICGASDLVAKQNERTAEWECR